MDKKVKSSNMKVGGKKLWSINPERKKLWRKHLSEVLKGQKPWNKGLTIETDSRIKKLSRCHKGDKHPMFGKYHSEIAKEKMRQAHTKLWQDDDYFEKDYIPNYLDPNHTLKLRDIYNECK